MTLTIKRIRNLAPQPSVSTLPDITQKPKHSTEELKQWLIDTVFYWHSLYSSGHHRRS